MVVHESIETGKHPDSKTVFTCPGMIGDNLYKLPIIWRYLEKHGGQADVILDARSKPIVEIVQEIPGVANVFLLEGIDGYPLGGQPYDFKRSTEFPKWYDNVYHLGFRSFPHTNLIWNSYEQLGVDLGLTREDLHRPLWEHPKESNPRTLCIHAESSAMFRAIETKESLVPAIADLAKRFDDIYIINKGIDPEFYTPLILPNVQFFGGGFKETRDLLQKSILVGTYSAMWALMSTLHGPQVILVDPANYNPHRRTTDWERMIYTKDPGRVLEEVDRLLSDLANAKETQAVYS